MSDLENDSIVLIPVESPISKEEIEADAKHFIRLCKETEETESLLRRLQEETTEIKKKLNKQFIYFRVTSDGRPYVVQATIEACRALNEVRHKLAELDMEDGCTDIFCEREFWSVWVKTLDEALDLINEPRAKKQKTESE